MGGAHLPRSHGSESREVGGARNDLRESNRARWCCEAGGSSTNRFPPGGLRNDRSLLLLAGTGPRCTSGPLSEAGCRAGSTRVFRSSRWRRARRRFSVRRSSLPTGSAPRGRAGAKKVWVCPASSRAAPLRPRRANTSSRGRGKSRARPRKGVGRLSTLKTLGCTCQRT